VTLRGVTGWARLGFARCSAVVMAVALEDRHTVRRLDVRCPCARPVGHSRKRAELGRVPTLAHSSFASGLWLGWCCVGRVCPLVYEDVYTYVYAFVSLSVIVFMYVYGCVYICTSLCGFSARVLLGGSLRVWTEDGQPCRTELI
jgi:hypothetical protein